MAHLTARAALDLHMHSGIAQGAKDALDNLRDSTGVVGLGTRHILYRRRTDPHSIDRRFGSARNPPGSGTQDRGLVGG
jgi:hypothetical protein